MHRVLVYNKNYDEAFFVTNFIRGLKPEIQSAIRLHKPRTVDTALSLAQTQEDMLEVARQVTSSRYRHDYKNSYKNTHTTVKSILGSPLAPDERKPMEEKHTIEQKLDALKAMRKAKCLCFKCGEKYHRGHKCAPSTQLQLIEDLLPLVDYKVD